MCLCQVVFLIEGTAIWVVEDSRFVKESLPPPPVLLWLLGFVSRPSKYDHPDLADGSGPGFPLWIHAFSSFLAAKNFF